MGIKEREGERKVAAVRFQKESEEFQMLQDYWKLMQEYWEPENNDIYWEKLIVAANIFYKTYQTPFSKALAVALVEEADRKCRNKEGEDENG